MSTSFQHILFPLLTLSLPFLVDLHHLLKYRLEPQSVLSHNNGGILFFNMMWLSDVIATMTPQSLIVTLLKSGISLPCGRVTSSLSTFTNSLSKILSVFFIFHIFSTNQTHLQTTNQNTTIKLTPPIQKLCLSMNHHWIRIRRNKETISSIKLQSFITKTHHSTAINTK